MDVIARSHTRHLVLAIGVIVALAFAPVAIRWAMPASELAQWRLGEARLALTPGNNGLASHSSSAGLLDGAPTTLPDAWNETHPGFGGVGHYHFTVYMEPYALADRALYVPRLSNRGIVAINGVRLVEPDDADGDSRRWNRPLYLAIPADQLQAGENRVVISVSGLANSRAGLSEVFFGPRQALYEAFRLRWFFQIDLLWIANLAVIALAIPFLFSWLRDPVGSANYGLFGAGSLLFGLRNFHGLIETSPLPFDYWRPLIGASLGWSLFFLFLFLLRFSDFRLRKLEVALTIFTTAGSIALFLLPSTSLLKFAVWLWYLPLFFAGLFCIGAFTYRTIAEPTLHRMILLFGVLGQIGPGAHDILWIQGTGSFSSTLWMALSFPIALIMMSMVLADDMAKTKAALGNMNKLLEARVAAARHDLEALYERRRATERETISTEERMRLMRDMHDGVGTRLSLLLSGLSQGRVSADEVEDAVRATLEELHLLLDARGPSTATLVDALANLRYRLGPRLDAVGMATRWEIGPGTEKIALSAEATLHVLRIIQECITNAVRHGQAKVVTFKIERTGPTSRTQGETSTPFVILIIDDGVGINNASALTKGGGRGLANIRARADALGGTFTLHSETTGTVARLAFPR